MRYQIYKYYKESLGLYNLVFVYIKGWYFALLLAPIIALVQTLILIFFNKIIAVLAVSIPFAVFIFILNYKAKKIVKAKYNIKSSEFFWNSEYTLSEIRKIEKDRLKKQLLKIDNSIDEIDLKRISEELSKDAELRKVQFPIIPSAFVILFIPVWNAFMGWFFRSPEIKTLKDASLMLGLLAFFILIFAGSMMAMKSIINDLFDIFLNKESRKMKRLSDLLEDIGYDIERDKRKKAKKLNV